jgi:hypothetical protein
LAALQPARGRRAVKTGDRRNLDGCKLCAYALNLKPVQPIHQESYLSERGVAGVTQPLRRGDFFMTVGTTLPTHQIACQLRSAIKTTVAGGLGTSKVVASSS